MRIVVEGSGTWAMQYLDALQEFGGPDVGVFFTYDSTFGLDEQAERLPARLFAEYLQATLRNAERVEEAGFACVDVKDTLFRLQENRWAGRRMLPARVDAVFVVTPDRTHCDVAEFWLDKAKRVFVEKPFDASVKRIEAFCNERRERDRTEVFALDHYFVRCNQVAADNRYFLDRLLPTDDGDLAVGDIMSFEFVLTEPPCKDESGGYDPTPMRRRALSLQGGMAFDLGAHALPMLQPFIDLGQPIEITEVWAGVCEELRGVLFSGAESFAAATVRCRTRGIAGKPSSTIAGTVVVGKDIGESPEKYLLLSGPAGQIRFDLNVYHVYYRPAGGEFSAIGSLQENWARFFVKEILEGRVPAAVDAFRPEGAARVIEFLEQWRARCQGGRVLAGYRPGATVRSLKANDYRRFP